MRFLVPLLLGVVLGMAIGVGFFQFVAIDMLASGFMSGDKKLEQYCESILDQIEASSRSMDETALFTFSHTAKPKDKVFGFLKEDSAVLYAGLSTDDGRILSVDNWAMQRSRARGGNGVIESKGGYSLFMIKRKRSIMARNGRKRDIWVVLDHNAVVRKIASRRISPAGG